MRCWSSCKHPGLQAMTQRIIQEIKTDRLGLTDLLEISDLLLRNQAISLRVAGWSMYPTLCKGDRLTVDPVCPTQLQVGDLLLFNHRGRLICHRLVAVQETGAGPQLITKGDAVTARGKTIQPEQVLGKVVAVARRWPWSHSGRWVGALARWVDQATERLTLFLAQWLQSIQKLRSYRWLMRTLLSRCVAYDVGTPEGRRWLHYDRIGGRRTPGALTGHHRFHLVAKLVGICLGSVRVTASGEGYWIDDLYVRIRYRGMGVGAHLLAMAATAAAMNGAHVLLASVEPANAAALRLFTKAGFCKTVGLRGNEVSLRRDL